MLGATQLDSSFGAKDLWVLMDTKLNMSQQCVLIAQTAKGIMPFIGWGVASRLKVVTFLCSDLIRQNVCSVLAISELLKHEKHEHTSIAECHKDDEGTVIRGESERDGAA